MAFISNMLYNDNLNFFLNKNLQLQVVGIWRFFFCLNMPLIIITLLIYSFTLH